MDLLNILKGKTSKSNNQQNVRYNSKQAQGEKELNVQKTGKEQMARKEPKELKAELSYGILKAPRVTEKSSLLAETGQYVFEVDKSVNKNAVRKAVEKNYNVKTESARVINLPKRQSRVGKKIVWKGGMKKAIVKLVRGQKIGSLSV